MRVKKFKDKVNRYNPQMTLQHERIEIGICQIIDGIISTITCGRYVSSFSSDAIEKSILAGIARRRAANERAKAITLDESKCTTCPVKWTS